MLRSRTYTVLTLIPSPVPPSPSWGTESSESTFLWKLSSFLHPLYQYDQTSVFHENCKNCLLIDLSHIVFYFLMLSLSSYWRDSPKIFILKPSILHYGHGMEYLNLNQGPLPTSISPSFIPCSSASAVVSGPIWDWALVCGWGQWGRTFRVEIWLLGVFYLFEVVCPCGFVHMNTVICGGQKRIWDSSQSWSTRRVWVVWQGCWEPNPEASWKSSTLY